MPPRGTRRQRVQEDYTDESDDNSYKRKKIERNVEETEKDSIEESEDYLQAIETLKKQRDNGLLLVQTELRLRLQNAKELAMFEESRINQLFNEQVEDLKQQIIDETKKEKMKQASEKKSHRPFLQPENYTLPKKDTCCFSVLLSEEDMVDDLLSMVTSTQQQYSQAPQLMPFIIVPLRDNRLLLGDRVIEPNTPCTVVNGSNRMTDCVFLSTTLGDREIREKKKEPEVVIRVSATRSKRYPISYLRDGSIQLEVNNKQ